VKKELFSVPIHYGFISSNDFLKEKLLPRIELTRDKVELPEDWDTNKLITSFNHNDFNEMIFDDITYYSYMDCISDAFGNTGPTKIQKLWYNYYADGEFQEIHNHIGDIFNPTHMCGVHFLQYDKRIHEPLVFEDPMMKLRSYGWEAVTDYEETFTVDASEGDVVFFPPYLDHKVKSGNPTPDYPRITVAFNIQFFDNE
jgi:hypothetical protein|tara:strand:+ start:2639 stop:3235 length:597 start_codon:yes stop_codon:yes gene_type:complete